MGRGLIAGLVALGLLTACSGGGGSAAKTTTTSTTTTSTTLATTSTTNPEDAVKQAYLDYWKMIDRLSATPEPNDPEIAARLVDPLLTTVVDDMSTRKSQGRTTRFPSDPALNAHRVTSVNVSGAAADLEDCFVDGRIAVSPDGSVNDNIVTKRLAAKLVFQSGAWLIKDVEIVEKSDGVSGCAVSA